MNPKPALIATLLSITPTVQANPVYRCQEAGKPVYFTDEPGLYCEEMDLKVVQPDPAEVARLQTRKLEQEEQERQAQEREDRERLIRAQEEAARAAEIQAEAQRRMAEQQQWQNQPQTVPPVYYPGGFWPGYGYPVRPLPPVQPNPPGQGEPAPGYPYGTDRGTLGGQKR